MKHIGKMTKVLVGSLILLLVLSTGVRETLADGSGGGDPAIGPNTVELLPYQASGYRFQIIGLGTTPPSGFEQPGFDDSAFTTGTAAFGSGGGCSLQATVQTFWPVNSELLVRKVVSIPPGATGVRVMVSIDNDIVGVFFNGTPISGFVSHDGCPILDEFRFDVPQGLVQPGPNLVVFHVLDRGVESFFDARVLAEVSVEVAIDIKPGSDPNSINPKSRGTIPVAILSTPTFDAPSEVDKTSLTFGRAGDEHSLAFCTRSDEDVNGDGLLDIVCHFNSPNTGFQEGDAEGVLKGTTVAGVPIEGRDSVRIVP